MIRSSKLSTKFANSEKKEKLHSFMDEYSKVVSFFIDHLWDLDKIPTLLPKEITQQVETWLSARAVQCAGKQASGIARGTQKKQKSRLYVYNKFLKNGFTKRARKLKVHIDKAKITKPNLDHVCPELDSRFIKLDFDNDTSFDGWVTFTSLGNKLKIQVPVKSTKHLNSLSGNLKQGVRLSKKSITFIAEEEVAPRVSGKTIGLDVGEIRVASLSDDQVTKPDQHGFTFSSIDKRLSRKKRGSKSFARTQTQRKHYVNWSINQLNFDGVKKLKLENLGGLRRGRRTRRALSHWTYTEIQGKLEQTCEKLGVQVEYISPTYTSQRCSSCGWVRRSNRNRTSFQCGKCNFALDADLNASRNIAASLVPIGTKERLLHKNRTGFYWHEVNQECIVPET